MPFPQTVTAPSPLADEMGSILHAGGCTFRIWSLFPTAVTLKLWGAGGAVSNIPLTRDSASGYGGDCWSAFVPGVTEGSNYRFVLTGANAGAGQVERVDPWGRSIVYPNWTNATLDDSDARSVVDSRDFDWGPAFQAPGWKELVIYQLHIGTFYDGTGGPSKIDGLIDKINYLQDLGVNAIQFLPFAEYSSPLSMGYNTALPYAIERDYGAPKDFKRLVSALHGAGMRVLIDVVYTT